MQKQESSIHQLRIFHNWIKKQLITDAVKYLDSPYDIKLLDLAVGRGGDINKWFVNKIKYVVGFDIDNDSIMEANKRYKDMKIPYNYKFYEMDLSQDKNITKVKDIIGNNLFDIVSCQFAIHYFFKNESTLHTILEITSSNLKTGGLFIGTTMNGDLIKKRLKHDQIFGNNIFTIKKGIDNKYIVSLGKKDDTDHYFVNYDSEEYYVEMEYFKKEALKYNLHFIGIINFAEWFKKYNGILSQDEKEFSFMNISFVFVKN